MPDIAMQMPGIASEVAEIFRMCVGHSGYVPRYVPQQLTTRNHGICLRSIRAVAETRYTSIRSVANISRQGRSWWCSETGRHGPTRDPHPTESPVQPLQVELFSRQVYDS